MSRDATRQLYQSRAYLQFPFVVYPLSPSSSASASSHSCNLHTNLLDGDSIFFSGISDAWSAFTGGNEQGAATDDQHGGDQEDEEAPLAATSLVVCWLADNDLMLVLPAPVPEGEGNTQLTFCTAMMPAGGGNGNAAPPSELRSKLWLDLPPDHHFAIIDPPPHSATTATASTSPSAVPDRQTAVIILGKVPAYEPPFFSPPIEDHAAGITDSDYLKSPPTEGRPVFYNMTAGQIKRELRENPDLTASRELKFFLRGWKDEQEAFIRSLEEEYSTDGLRTSEEMCGWSLSKSVNVIPYFIQTEKGAEDQGELHVILPDRFVEGTWDLGQVSLTENKELFAKDLESQLGVKLTQSDLTDPSKYTWFFDARQATVLIDLGGFRGRNTPSIWEPEAARKRDSDDDGPGEFTRNYCVKEVFGRPWGTVTETLRCFAKGWPLGAHNPRGFSFEEEERSEISKSSAGAARLWLGQMEKTEYWKNRNKSESVVVNSQS